MRASSAHIADVHVDLSAVTGDAGGAAALPHVAGAGAAGQPGGSSGGATYVSNITLPGGGGTRQLRVADANSQSAAEQLLRDLAQAKGAAS